jgi:hypothetical protein
MPRVAASNRSISKEKVLPHPALLDPAVALRIIEVVRQG